MAYRHTRKTMQGTSCWRTDLQGLSISQEFASYSNCKERNITLKLLCRVIPYLEPNLINTQTKKKLREIAGGA